MFGWKDYLSTTIDWKSCGSFKIKRKNCRFKRGSNINPISLKNSRKNSNFIKIQISYQKY